MEEINWSEYKKYFAKLGASKENIVLINNFIDTKDLNIINQYLESHENNDDFMGGKDIREEQVKKENTDVYNILVKYEEKVFQEAKRLFTDKHGIPLRRKAVNSTHFVKWVPGMQSKLHCDCEKPDGSPALAAEFFRYNVSVLMYPNENYSGGEITFPDYDIVIKPKAGDMILFPGNGAYKHTVELITEGVRYTMPSWYTYDIETKVEHKEWSYKDSVQLWPEEKNQDPVGNLSRERFLNEKPKMEK